MTPPVIQTVGLRKRFIKELDTAEKLARLLGANLNRQVVAAVDGIDLEVARGEVVGIVGESGCGKSTLGRIIAGLLSPSGGEILFHGRRMNQVKGASLKVQMIFQDPMSSLNPRMKIEKIIGEAPLVHRMISRQESSDFVDDLLIKVGLNPSVKRRYPHQFSGGQRQRIGIARALAVNPEFIVCDEAVAALDVSIQSQIINLFMKLREEFELTYLFISHDLGVVEHISDRVAVMYLGRIVETGSTDEIFSTPNHPYTRALLDEIPRLGAQRTVYGVIKGEIPSPLDPPRGCHFHPRCPHAFDRCRKEAPDLKPVAPGRRAACHLNDSR